MEFNKDLYLNRLAAIKNMSAKYNQNSTLQELLEKLSNKELRLIQKNSDLVDRIYEISKMDMNTASIILEEDFCLSLDDYEGNSCWVGIEEIEKHLPKWIRYTHVGWALEEIEEFMSFARDFFLQEVRINLWMRYYEHKKTSKPNQKELGYSGFGLYL